MSTTVFSDVDWNKAGKQVGSLFLPHSPDDDAWGVIPYPAASIKNGDGPVVVVSGGVHGDEYEGPVVINELVRQIQTEDVQGQLILLPTFNAPALRAGRRTSPIDRLNLARVFPGDDFGTSTQQIARYVADRIFARANFYLDLHAGGRTLFIEPSTHVVMSDEMNPDVVKENARLAEVFGVGVTVQTSNMGDYRTSCGYTSMKGIPTLAAEMGMGGWVTGDSVQATRDATRRFLKHTGVLPRIATIAGVKTRWTRINGADAYVFAPCDGYFERRFNLGDPIVAGQLAGLIHQLSRPAVEPEPVYFKSAGTLYAHGLVGHVRAGQNLAVLTEDVARPD
ncbi:MAG: succinylglutamate desuccinylase/aspartoacylase family protein [Luteimonas sp.]|nr:succinylglutamate desuccinylase/aspartoacylase family protein [Betaproteobacteria bacterium]MBA3774822.1 succinylglutamate desuccinylase/aspartoacylase family protein [Betaproteobacteria bacterium]